MDRHLHISSHEVAGLLRELLRLLDHQGAWFSPDLVVYGHNGDLSMRSLRSHTDRRSYIRIPLACMPLCNEFEITLQDSLFSCRPTGENVDSLHVDIMTLMFEVFNRTGKPDWWRSVCPFFALASWPDVSSHLLHFRKNVPKLGRFSLLLAAGDLDTLLVETFLGARVFNLSTEHLHELGRKDAAHGQPVIMPLIDYFNHCFQAESYSVLSRPAPPSMRVFGIPDDTGEVSVRYNLYDPLDTLLFYGFVDVDAPWLASVPLALELPDGRSLKVLNAGGTVKKNLPQPVRDLRMYLPMVQQPDAEEILISKLLVPGPAAPRALQRVLAYLLQNLCPGLKQAELLQWVERLENELLERNLRWWEELNRLRRDVPEELPIGRALKDLCSFSLNHLRSYCSGRPPLG